MTPPDTAASIPHEGTDCTAEEAVEAVRAVRASAALDAAIALAEATFSEGFCPLDGQTAV